MERETLANISATPRFASSLQRVCGWMVWPGIHLFNNVDQWETVFELRTGEPTPAAIAPKPADYGDDDPPPGEEGLEPPSSFWPKFEHRFRPAEQTWVADAKPAALRAGRAGTQFIRLFDRVLEARDGLVASLPPDGQTPRTRVGGQAILFSMKRLMDNMDAFEGFASNIGGVLPSGFGDEVNSWWSQGPHEYLNY